jgi:ADP-heptose:LPS heptosyltransferase
MSLNKGWACAVRAGGIGDNLIAGSVFRGLRERYGKLEVITRVPAGVVYENNPYIDKLTFLPEEDNVKYDAVGWQRHWQERAREYEFFIHLAHTCEISLALMEGQTQFGWPAKARRRLFGESYLNFVHDLVDIPHDFGRLFWPTDEEETQAWDTLNKVRSARPGGAVIGWCISGSRIDKLYPHTPRVIGKLLDQGMSVIMLGAPTVKDKELAKQIQEDVQTQCGTDAGLHLAISHDAKEPNWPIRRVLTQAIFCDLVVSPDTGPAWAVAMEDVPKVIMVSHTSVKNITHGWLNTITLHADPARVPCWPCHQLHDTFETCTKAKNAEAAACMDDISVPVVVRTIERALKGSAAS